MATLIRIRYCCLLLILVMTVVHSQTISCAGLPNSLGLNSSPTSCYCLNGYSWVSTACVADGSGGSTTYNCATIANTAGNNGSGCICITGFYWVSGYCYRNCSLIAFSTGVNNSTDSCVCQTGYVWNSPQCLSNSSSGTINCSNIPNSLGVNNGTNSCWCISGYSWISSACQLNCTSVTNSLGVNNGPYACISGQVILAS
jgi:hypothetical protein